MSAPTAAQLAALRKSTHAAAKGFASYNFRQCTLQLRTFA